jgi:Ni/Co efflux regulator RcnB
MKTTKLLLIVLVASAMVAGSAAARSTPRTNATTSMTSARSVSHWGNQRHHRHHRSHSNVFFGIGLGYPYYGYGYPYYGSYPYGYGYYARPRTVIYSDAGLTDDATVAAVQRRLARAGYYHGAIDGVIGSGTRNAIRSYERQHGLAIDGRIDRQLLATMGLA